MQITYKKLFIYRIFKFIIQIINNIENNVHLYILILFVFHVYVNYLSCKKENCILISLYMLIYKNINVTHSMLIKNVNLCIHTHLYYRLLNVLHMCETKRNVLMER